LENTFPQINGFNLDHREKMKAEHIPLIPRKLIENLVLGVCFIANCVQQ